MKITSLSRSLALAAGLISFAATAQVTPPPAAPAGRPPAGQTSPQDPNAPSGRATRANVQRGNMAGGVGGINLDEKQRQLLQEARQVNSDEVRKLNEKLAEAQKEFVKVVVAEKYVENTVREKAEALAKIQTELLMLNAKAFATVSPTLKPEQREQLENSRVAIAIISPAGGMGGGPVNFGGGPNAGFGGGRGNFQPGADGGPGGVGRGGDPGLGGDRRGGQDVNGGNPRRRGENPPQ